MAKTAELFKLTPDIEIEEIDTLPDFETYDANGEITFESDPLSGNFNENLALAMSDQDRKKIAATLIPLLEEDKRVRDSEWTVQIEKALVLVGVKEVSAPKIPFKGASNLVHPAVFEACVQYSSRAIEEIFPATGPAKTTVVGEKTTEALEQADRVADYLNYRLTEDDPGYYDDTDNLLFKQAFFGSIFRKTSQDIVTGKAKNRQVTAERFIAPYDCQSLEDCPRYAHEMSVYINDIKRAVAEGKWRDIGDIDDAADQPITEIERDSDKKDNIGEKSTRVLYEAHCDYTIPGDPLGSPDYDLPYVVVIDREMQDVYSIRRNWKQNDPLRRKRIWFSHYKYLQGLGFYGWGLVHAIGHLGAAISGSMRAMLDAAARATMPGGFKTKDARFTGPVSIGPGEWVDVDATFDELQKSFFKLPYEEPPDMLFQMMKAMIEATQRFANTTETMVGDAPNTGPVGTTLALIEQGSKVYSAIHKRTHVGMRNELRAFVELERETLEENGDIDYPYFMGDAQSMLLSDLDETVDVLPVSDPNIFSNAQRIALAQATMQLIASAPQLYGPGGLRRAHMELLKALKAPNPELLLLPEGPSYEELLQKTQMLEQQLAQGAQQMGALTAERDKTTQALGQAHAERDKLKQAVEQGAQQMGSMAAERDQSMVEKAATAEQLEQLKTEQQIAQDEINRQAENKAQQADQMMEGLGI